MNILTSSEAKDKFRAASLNGQAAGRRAVKAVAAKAATAASAVPKPPEVAHWFADNLPKLRLTAQLPRPAEMIVSTRELAEKMLDGERRLARKVLPTPEAPKE
jgi:hypothetical protein